MIWRPDFCCLDLLPQAWFWSYHGPIFYPLIYKSWKHWFKQTVRLFSKHRVWGRFVSSLLATGGLWLDPIGWSICYPYSVHSDWSEFLIYIVLLCLSGLNLGKGSPPGIHQFEEVCLLGHCGMPVHPFLMHTFMSFLFSLPCLLFVPC